MSMTTKFDQALLKTAYNFADLSHCKRLKVGAVIAKDGRPLVTGYNGNKAGSDNCCEEVVGVEKRCGRCGCEDQDKLHFSTIGSFTDNACDQCKYYGVVREHPLLKTKPSVIHAEQNAIYYAARNGIATEGCDIYITHAPCEMCAEAIASCGIKRVIFATEYRDDKGIKNLRDHGLEVTLVPLASNTFPLSAN